MKYTVNQLPEMQSWLDVAPPPSYSCGLDPFKADCKLGDYSCFGKKLPNTWNRFVLFLFCDFCGVDLKGRKKESLVSDMWRRYSFPKWPHWRERLSYPQRCWVPCGGSGGKRQCSSQRSWRTISKWILSRLYWVSSSVCMCLLCWAHVYGRRVEDN